MYDCCLIEIAAKSGDQIRGVNNIFYKYITGSTKNKKLFKIS